MVDTKQSGSFFTQIWDFFASVQLAIATLGTISLVSIIGTVLPQKQPLDLYIQKFGPQTARFFELFHLNDLYGSLWFRALLALLCVNLIVCSIDRFPRIWKLVTADKAVVPMKRLLSMKLNTSWTTEVGVAEAKDQINHTLQAKGWKTVVSETEDGTLLFSQKGAWTRLGVFIVHGSILVILVGAIIGSILGFKGTLSLLEGQTTDTISTFGSNTPINLGFKVRCDGFNIEYYANGMPKEYRSDLTVLENGREVLHKAVVVNHPLTYHGITFYQSSYQAYNDFLFSIADMKNGDKKTFMVPYQKQIQWQQEGLRFGVINAQSSGEKIDRFKVWITGPKGQPAEFWMKAGSRITFAQGGKQYVLTGRQLYATGLQVAKDPGIWFVYIGCGLIIFGLFVSFFMSHRKIWILISENKNKTTVVAAGSANKNKAGFDERFSRLTNSLTQMKKA